MPRSPATAHFPTRLLVRVACPGSSTRTGGFPLGQENRATSPTNSLSPSLEDATVPRPADRRLSRPSLSVLRRSPCDVRHVSTMPVSTAAVRERATRSGPTPAGEGPEDTIATLRIACTGTFGPGLEGRSRGVGLRMIPARRPLPGCGEAWGVGVDAGDGCRVGGVSPPDGS